MTNEFLSKPKIRKPKRNIPVRNDDHMHNPSIPKKTAQQRMDVSFVEDIREQKQAHESHRTKELSCDLCHGDSVGALLRSVR